MNKKILVPLLWKKSQMKEKEREGLGLLESEALGCE
jgi:hypothetical protein